MTAKKIRATLGETVIVGEEAVREDTGPSGEHIGINVGAPQPLALVDIWLNDGWEIEYIQELPTLPGAIVRNLSRTDGALYVRHSYGDGPYTWIPLNAPGEFWGDTVAEGGFEVLFGGVG